MKIILITTIIILMNWVAAYGQVAYEKFSIDTVVITHINGNIASKGMRIIEAGNPNMARNTKPVGLWQYWYDNTKKQYEVIYGKENKYINCWTREGKQILKNGNGFWYDLAQERMAWIVKDSVLIKKIQLYEITK
jgi:hypothetical protein